MTKKQYDIYHSIGLSQTAPEEIIEQLANRLLQSLYIPVKDDRQWIKDDHLTMDDEAINWGDLSATVDKVGEGYMVTISEVAPGSYQMIEYVRGYLESWGWECMVQCEW